MAHAWRKFTDVIKTSKSKGLTSGEIKYFRALYKDVSLINLQRRDTRKMRMPSKEEIKKENEILRSRLALEKQKGTELNNEYARLLASLESEKQKGIAKIYNLKESNLEEHSAFSQLTRIKLHSNPLPSVTSHSILKSSKRKKSKDESTNQQVLEHEESFSVVSSKKR